MYFVNVYVYLAGLPIYTEMHLRYDVLSFSLMLKVENLSSRNILAHGTRSNYATNQRDIVNKKEGYIDSVLGIIYLKSSSYGNYHSN